MTRDTLIKAIQNTDKHQRGAGVMATEIIDRGRYKRGDTILIGGEPYHVIKRSWFTDKDGFYTYTVEGVVVTDAFVNWLLDPVCDRTDSVGRLNAEDIPKLLQEFNDKGE